MRRGLVALLIGWLWFCSAAEAAQDQVLAVTVGTSSAQALAAATATRSFLLIQNLSNSANIACRFGAAAALNTAGSFMIPAGQTFSWDLRDPNQFALPNTAVNCIASAASTPVTIQVAQ